MIRNTRERLEKHIKTFTEDEKEKKASVLSGT